MNTIPTTPPPVGTKVVCVCDDKRPAVVAFGAV